MLDLYPDEIEQARQEYILAQAINETWHLNEEKSIHRFWKLRDEISKLCYSVDPLKADSTLIPPPFCIPLDLR